MGIKNSFGGGITLRRRMMMLAEMGEEEMAKEFKMVDTILFTPGEKTKNIDMSAYGYTEFLIRGNIPKTANSTYFRIGAGDYNAIPTKHGTDAYAAELVAHVYIIDGKLLGFMGFDSGWANGNVSGLMVPTPRSAAPTTSIKISFYPFVEGDEQAVIEIYGR